MRIIQRWFITGLLILTPLFVTGYILYKIFVSVDNLIGPFKARYPVIDFPGVGVVAVFLLVFFVGLLGGNLIGRRILSWAEKLFHRIPLIRGIYGTVKELSEVFFSDRRTLFKRVVLIRYPHRDSFALAFVTQESAGDFETATGNELVSVFVPTTPNPTSGFLLLVPKQEVVPLALSVEDGMKMVISGGAVIPGALPSEATRG
jgi:uncharacterized membrane protein